MAQAAQVIQFPNSTPTTDTEIIAEAAAFLAETEGRASQDRAGWRKVGQALLIGRKLHPSNIAFGKWSVENGFGNLDRRVRADAIWLALNWSSVVQSLDNGNNHPTAIRAAYNATPDNGDDEDEGQAEAPAHATQATRPASSQASSPESRPAQAPQTPASSPTIDTADTSVPWDTTPPPPSPQTANTPVTAASPPPRPTSPPPPETFTTPVFNADYVGVSLYSAALEIKIHENETDEDAMTAAIVAYLRREEAKTDYVARFHRILGKVLSQL